ncbi:MAG: hypothetical protein AAFQ66_15395 [Pseudomonadota bacterium]
MKIDSAMEAKYPELSRWIERHLPRVRFKFELFRVFARYTEGSKKDARAMLKRGSLPLINARDLKRGANGAFNASWGHNTVWLSTEVCEKFETNETAQKDARMHRLIESTLLHEMVHWCDFSKDGKHKTHEVGEDFEEDAYGYNVGRYWI